MRGLAIRTALPADADIAIDLIWELNRFEAEICPDRLTDRAAAEAYYGELLQRLAKGQGRLLLAEAEGRALALMGFVIEEDAAYKPESLRRHATVTDLVVTEEARGRGVGRRLLEEAERLAREAGLSRLVIGAIEGNERALDAYGRFGFGPYARILLKELG